MFKNRVVHFDFPIDQKICPTLYDICTTRPADIKRRVARPVPAKADVDTLDEPEDAPSSSSRPRREEIGRSVPSPAHMAPPPQVRSANRPASEQFGFNGGDNRDAVAAKNERMEDMDIRDFQEGVSFSRFNTRRLPTEEELRAQAEAELKELVLNAIDQVFTRESDTHFDDFALALSAAGITLGADPSGDIAFSNGTVALSGSEVGYTLPALVAMSERANGLDAVTEPQPPLPPSRLSPSRRIPSRRPLVSMVPVSSRWNRRTVRALRRKSLSSRYTPQRPSRLPVQTSCRPEACIQTSARLSAAIRPQCRRRLLLSSR